MHTLYVCVSVCVWVGERERERERESVFGFQLFHTENALCKVVSEKIMLLYMHLFICIYVFICVVRLCSCLPFFSGTCGVLSEGWRGWTPVQYTFFPSTHTVYFYSLIYIIFIVQMQIFVL